MKFDRDRDPGQTPVPVETGIETGIPVDPWSGHVVLTKKYNAVDGKNHAFMSNLVYNKSLAKSRPFFPAGAGSGTGKTLKIGPGRVDDGIPVELCL